MLHCAGPFSQTARQMMDACIAAGADYLDITGEIEVIERAAARGERARQAGVALMPAVGFDVVPSDCLAAMLAERLPGARVLQLAFAGWRRLQPRHDQDHDRVAPQRRPGANRRRNPPRADRLEDDGGSLSRRTSRWRMTIPWGDVASAVLLDRHWQHRSLYGDAPQPDRPAAAVAFHVAANGFQPVAAAGQALGRAKRKRPQTHELRDGPFVVLGAGSATTTASSVSATLETLSGYKLTAHHGRGRIASGRLTAKCRAASPPPRKPSARNSSSNSPTRTSAGREVFVGVAR